MTENRNKGNLVVISGFSGAGKGTVVRELVDRYDYRLSVSATTRKPREGEVDGVHYFFHSREEFEDLIRENGLIEYARYVDNYYGTPRSFVEETLAEGKTVILEIEVQGAMAIRSQYPDAILIFITAPSARELAERLAGRGTESEELVNKRLERAFDEADSMEAYDYVVCNEQGRVAECVETIRSIIRAENCRLNRQKELIQDMKKGFREILSSDKG